MKKTKVRILSVVLAVLLITGAIIISVVASYTPMVISVSSESGQPGRTVTVKINLRDNPGISSMKLKVAFDSILTLDEIVYNGDFGGQTILPQTMASPATLMWVSPLANCNLNAAFATLTFTVSESAEAGAVANISVTYNPDDIYNMDEDNVDCTVENATVTVLADSTKLYADGVETSVDEAITSFAAGDVSVLAVPDGVDLSGKTVTAPAGGELVINTGASYDITKITGASGAIISDANTGIIYGWKVSSSSWAQRNPTVSIATANCQYNPSQSSINTSSAIQGNIVSGKVTGIGVIFIPKAALAISAGGLGDLNGDGDRTNADLTAAYLTNEYAACGSMSISVGSSGQSYYSASLLTTAPNTTIVCGWYVKYQVGDAAQERIFFPSSETASNVKPSDFA